MMKAVDRSKNLFALLLATLTLVVSNVAVAQEQLWQMVWSSHEQAKSMSYSGLLVTESGTFSQSSRLVHQSKPEGEFELLERLDGQPAKWIRHNDQIQCVIPDRKLILTERRHTAVSFPRVFADRDGSTTLEKFYSIAELPAQRVAGRTSHVLKLTPKDDLRYQYRLYLDRSTKLLLKSEVYAANGEVLENVGFKEINFDPAIKESLSLLKPGPGWRTSKTEIRPLTEEEAVYDLPDIAFGFKKTDTVCRTKGGNEQIHQTIYSDGLSTVSIFIQQQRPSQSMPQVPMSHGAVMSKSEAQGAHLVTVLGEVPEKTLDLFLKSVRWKSQ